jgi:hypothetical protein
LSAPRVPEGVIAQPSAPQLSSSQAVIWAWRRPSPPGGMAILTRTGNVRSAVVIISRGLPGISCSLFVLCKTVMPRCILSSGLGARAGDVNLRGMRGRVRLSSDVSEIELVFSIPPHRPTPNFPPSGNPRRLICRR